MFYKFHWTAWVEKWDVTDWLNSKRGREPSASLSGKEAWQVSAGRDPSTPQAHRGPGCAKNPAPVLVGEVTTADAPITWLLWLCCLWNSQLICLYRDFMGFFCLSALYLSQIQDIKSFYWVNEENSNLWGAMPYEGLFLAYYNWYYYYYIILFKSNMFVFN